LQTYPWNRHYVYQPEVYEYLRHVTDRHDLRKDMIFNTAMVSADWDDNAARWIVRTSTGITFRARYLVTALGLLSKQNFPDIAGIDSFSGEKYHTGAWPEGVTLEGKRVGVIGNGSTGVQVITEIAKDVKHLVCCK
jgi:cation diffusion facilitator CzcD-associated flavoprotein CzcO